ncbi:menaquinone-specific isochorismate synthase [Friedmanniella endophytica]|uniref:isochorismate synthase n=1 Tax=Microlunatus kandeliicorticis TaxID=1759536 RepID=A0A7W3IPC9_9ACTN|nr:isochorismate synthase [Microlunatus kandeliicorticis]MBA8792776.1 menaquinone-specific isochorismate synthase [Microlunatus kandeliicorticis]
MISSPRLYVRTEAIADPGPLDQVLEQLAASDPRALVWIRAGDGMIGLGEVIRHKATDVADAEAWWGEVCRAVVDVSTDPDATAGLFGSGLLCFGSFVFDPDNTAGQSVMIVPQQVIGRRAGRAWRTRVAETEEALDQPPVPDPVSRSLPASVSLPVAAPGRVGPASPASADSPASLDGTDSVDGRAERDPRWERAVADAVGRIRAGRLDKVVLARDLTLVAERPVDPRWVATRLADRYRRCWTYHVDGLVGATPEMLIRREGGLAVSRVLAGTIRRSAEPAGAAGRGATGDQALAAALASSTKDVEEHEYAVSSVAAALAPFCSAMNVPDAPYVLELPNVLHLATDVTAVARPEATALRLAAALHPSAAVCGTPTAVARETIAELERMDRDRYAGPVGWVDADGDGEWAIALRCGLVDADDPHRIRLFAGCGIVAGSEPVAESAEAAAKFLPMREALGAG